MACFKSEMSDSFYSTELQAMKTTIHDKFESLHISLDERESDLLFELEGTRGTIESAIKQWEQKVRDVEHTKSHARTDIQDNKWSYKLMEEAKEELSLLESTKPCFDFEFKLDEKIKDVFSNLGEIHMERTNRRRTRIVLQSEKTDETGLGEKFERPTTLDKFTVPDFCPIFPDEKCGFEFEKQVQPVTQHPKIRKCSSCLEISTAQVLRPEIQVKNNLRAFDDSCIVKESVMQTKFATGKQQQQQRQQQQQEWKFLTIDHRDRKQTKDKLLKKPSMVRKGIFNRSIKKKRATTVGQGATYNLSELKIHKYLAKPVSLYSRWDKTKEVTGTLRCVVTGQGKIPIVGIELQTADGTSNGDYQNIQYFKTDRFKAYFLPADRVNIII